eukprot:4041749-Alexandrium_andersonii.AAC.1
MTVAAHPRARAGGGRERALSSERAGGEEAPAAVDCKEPEASKARRHTARGAKQSGRDASDYFPC